MTNEDRVLLEDMNGKLDAILEGQEMMGPMSRDIAQLKEDVFDLKNDLRGFKVGVKDQFRNHDRRITRLEQK